MTNSPLILILGATGKTGSRVARILKENGLAVRRASRSGGDVPFDWDDYNSWDAALNGANRAYIVGPVLKTNIIEQVSAFLDRAEANHISHVTFLSAYDHEAMPEDTGLRAVEIELDSRKNFTHTILRPAWFMQNFTETFLKPIGGNIVVPAGDGSEAFIDVEDIAAVAAETLQHPQEHAGKTYMLTGPEALTVQQAAKVISNTVTRDINYINLDREDWIKGVLGSGVPAEYGEVLRKLTSKLAEHSGSQPTGDVQNVIGRSPIRFADFVHREISAWSEIEIN